MTLEHPSDEGQLIGQASAIRDVDHADQDKILPAKSLRIVPILMLKLRGTLMPPQEPFTLARLAKLIAINIWRFLKKIDRISVRISLALVVVIMLADAGVVAGVLYLWSPASPPVPKVTLTRLSDVVDLGDYCGSPASGNLVQVQCQWSIPDFDEVCESQYPALPRPIRMSFSDPLNPSSGQCYASNGEVPGGVKMTDYCNKFLVLRPAGIDYEAVPVKNSNSWICARRLDTLAVCISTFQKSNLEARIENGKIICYARR